MGDELSLRDVTVALRKQAAKIEETGALAVRKVAGGVVAQAQATVPVLTGATRDSITAKATGGGDLGKRDLSADIGPTTWYAPLIEYGTARREPRPFMGQAADYAAEGLEFVLGSWAADLFGFEVTTETAATWSATAPSGATYGGLTGS